MSAPGPASSTYASAVSAVNVSSSTEPPIPGSGPGGSPAMSPSAVAGTVASVSR